MCRSTDKATVANGVDGVLVEIPEAAEEFMGIEEEEEEEEEEAEEVIMQPLLQRIPRTLLLRPLGMRR